MVKTLRSSQSIASARKQLAACGMTLRRDAIWEEYRVNFVGGSDDTAYYTDDLDDALQTGLQMAALADSGQYFSRPDRRGKYEVGQTVRFRRSDGKVCADVVRGHFVAKIIIEPYGRNECAPALILTEHSWCFVRDVIQIEVPTD